MFGASSITDEAPDKNADGTQKGHKFTDISFVLNDEHSSASGQGGIRMQNSADKKSKRSKRKPKAISLKESKDNMSREDHMNVDESLKILEDNEFNWYAADLYICPPSNADCSDEDGGDKEELKKQTPDNLSRSQLLADCEIQLDCFDENEMVIISKKDELNKCIPTGKKVCINKWIACQEKDKMFKLKEVSKPSKKKEKDRSSKGKQKTATGKGKKKVVKDETSIENTSKNGDMQDTFEN